MTNIIQVRDLTKHYTKKKTVKAVSGVNFHIDEGKVLGIIGESGCGKSTLGRILVALERPTTGKILFKNQPIENILKKDMLSFRRQCQMIFQNPFDTFDPRNNIESILTRTLKIHKIGNSEKERLDKCIEAMEKAGMVPARDYLKRYPHELSGGQLQRISIIRAMILEPSLIIADEPVSMLDVSVRADIINTLLQLTRENGTAMLFISHDIATTRYISDRIAVMYLGKIVEMGNTEDIVKNPKHPYTKVLISNCASIDSFERPDPIKVKGEPPTPIDIGEGCYFASRCYKAQKKCKESYPEIKEVEKEHYVSCFYVD